MKFTRRKFNKAALTLVSTAGLNIPAAETIVPVKQDEDAATYPGCAAHNCKGRCVIRVHVVNNAVKRITTDERPDSYDTPQMRACLRCRAYKTRLHHPDRLKYPLIYDENASVRGDITKFRRATWEEAMSYIKAKYQDIRKRHGPECVFRASGSGSTVGLLHGREPFERVLNALGGFIHGWGGYSNHALRYTSSLVAGKQQHYTFGTTPKNWMHTQTMLLWGTHIATSVANTNAVWWLTQARENGMKSYYIGPVYENTGELADEWVPIKPGTDSAMMLAMLYEMIVNGWLDRQSIDNFSIGFFDDPKGMKTVIRKGTEEYLKVPAGMSLSAFINGKTSYKLKPGSKYEFKQYFNVPKTPEWAEKITGVPAAKIREIAKAYATKKPSFLYASLGLQRQSAGIDNVWLSYALAIASGNWGKTGTGAVWYYISSDNELNTGNVKYSSGKNPVPHPARFSNNTWPDAVRSKGNGTSQYSDSEIRGMTEPIKMIFSVGGNALVNQHMDTFVTTDLLADRSNVELIVVTDNFMTPSARYADVILPGTTHFEQEDILPYNNNLIYQSRAIDAAKSVGDVKSHFEMGEMLADTFGLKDEKGRNVATGGKNVSQWVEDMYNAVPRDMSFEEWKKQGIYTYKTQGTFTGSMDIRANGKCDGKLNFGTKTGYIELYSRALVEEYENRGRRWGAPGHANVDSEGDPEVFPIAKYLPFMDEYRDTALKKAGPGEYPFHCLGSHSPHRTHSSNANNPALRELYKYGGEEYEPIHINPLDAAVLGLSEGMQVKVTSAMSGRAIYAAVKPTWRCTHGVVIVRDGSWFDPVAVKGTLIDRGGCPNTLVSEQPTRCDRGPAMMTVLVKIEKA